MVAQIQRQTLHIKIIQKKYTTDISSLKLSLNNCNVKKDYLSSDVASASSCVILSLASSMGIDNPNLCSLSWSLTLNILSYKSI